MKRPQTLLCILLLPLVFTSCFEDQDDNPVSTSTINDFVYKAMDIFYYYKNEVPALAENKQEQSSYNSYLNSFSTPEALFESLIHDRDNIDKFSWITDDYIALEQQFAGVSTSNGMEYGLTLAAEGSNNVLGYVRYILPSTSASGSTLKRGDIFYAINDTPLTISNYRSLLSEDNYTITLAEYNDNGTPETTDDSIDPTEETISLNKVPYTENPVFKTEILEVNGANVGYLMYNGFVGNFNEALNNAFATFKSNNVQNLVLDLRYNPGGSVNSATLLGSMITGQFNNQVFSKLVYNDQLQNYNTSYNFTNSFDGGTVNNLNLSTVYVIATNSSASASEMIINSLSDYINVVHIGTNTTGKSQASVTLYDSPNFNKSNVNPTHTYALQPIVAVSKSNSDKVVPANGLIPNIALSESINALGVLGDVNEPLLAEALAAIGLNKKANKTQNTGKSINVIFDSNDLVPHKKGMYID